MAVAETVTSDSPLERLNAALTDDALTSSSLPEPSLTKLNDRVRVDSLMLRANRLFEIGQLEQALRAAKSALEIGESSQIDYSPDEDRPIDLVRRIEGLLEASEIADQSKVDGGESAISSTSTEKETSLSVTDPAKRSKRPEKDSSGLTRIRRDWSTLFRGNRKSGGQESDAAAQSTTVTPPEPTANPGTASRSKNRETQTADRNAIVMANRSVSLGTPESIIEISSSEIDGVMGRNIAGRTVDEANSFETETLSLTEIEPSDDSDSRELSIATGADSLKIASGSDDDSSSIPELDPDDGVTPFHELESNSDVLHSPQATDVDEPDRKSDWTGFYLVFGLCSCLAFACYRRGAT